MCTFEMDWPRISVCIFRNYVSGLIISYAYLVLVLNFQHGSGTPEILHYRLRLLQELITVYRSLHTQNKETVKTVVCEKYHCYGRYGTISA